MQQALPPLHATTRANRKGTMKRIPPLIMAALACSLAWCEKTVPNSVTLEISLMIDDTVEVLPVDALGDVRRQVVDFCAARTDDSEVRRCARNMHDHAVKMVEEGRQLERCKTRNLLVTAHPDDEVIFGFDSLVAGQEADCWTIVCVTAAFNTTRRSKFDAAISRVRSAMVGTLSRYEIWNYLSCVDCVPMFPVSFGVEPWTRSTAALRTMNAALACFALLCSATWCDAMALNLEVSNVSSLRSAPLRSPLLRSPLLRSPQSLLLPVPDSTHKHRGKC